jgi:aldose 1-epimerase
VAEFILENEWLLAEFHPRGAALSRLIYKPLARDIVLNCDDHSASHHYTNAVVGPIANRVSNGRFPLGDTHVQLDQNEGTTCLHGGENGLSELDWIGHKTTDTVVFNITLKRNHSALFYIATYTARYQLIGQSLNLHLSAICDQDTAINLAPHLYFTLGADDVSALMLTMNAEEYLPVDEIKIPTGEIASVDGSDFDFRRPVKLAGHQIDHSFCLNKSSPAASLSYDGLTLDLSTTAPALQVYTADHLDRTAVALEPQGWPDAVNQKHFPTQIVKANTLWAEHSKIDIRETLTK